MKKFFNCLVLCLPLCLLLLASACGTGSVTPKNEPDKTPRAIITQDGRVAVSKDMKTWYYINTSTTVALNDFACASTDCVAVGEGGTITQYNSFNDTWTTQASGTESELWAVVSDGNRYVAVGEESFVFVYMNGWQKTPSTVESALYAIVYVNGVYKAVGQGGAFISSGDAMTWTRESFPSTNNLNLIGFFNSRFFILGDNGTLFGSADGAAWNQYTLTTEENLETMVFASNLYVVGGTSKTILTSKDGTLWQQVSGLPEVLDEAGDPIDYNIFALDYIEGIGFLAYADFEEGSLDNGLDNGAILFSSDGSTWAFALSKPILAMPGIDLDKISMNIAFGYGIAGQYVDITNFANKWIKNQSAKFTLDYNSRR